MSHTHLKSNKTTLWAMSFFFFFLSDRTVSPDTATGNCATVVAPSTCLNHATWRLGNPIYTNIAFLFMLAFYYFGNSVFTNQGRYKVKLFVVVYYQ